VVVKISLLTQLNSHLSNIQAKLFRTKSSTPDRQLLACLVALTTLLRPAAAAVAIGVGRPNPANAGECLDPDTGLNHTLGQPWRLAGYCGQAHCETRGGSVYISYAL